MSDLQQHISSLERLVGDQPKSPLFARLASLYIEAGRPKDALRLCDAGLAGFPFYSTGHFIKGKALFALNMKNEARREFEFVRDWLPTNPTVSELLENLPASEEDLLAEPTASIPAEPPAAVEVKPPTPIPPKPVESPPEPGGMAMFDRAPETAAAPPSAPAEESNVFGLSSVAPTLSPDTVDSTEVETSRSSFGSMDGFGATPEEAVASPVEQVPTPPSIESAATFESAFGAMGSAPSGTASYEAFAARMRDELGQGGTQSLEEFLASGGVSEAPAAFVEPTMAIPQPEPSPEGFAASSDVHEGPSDLVHPKPEESFSDFGMRDEPAVAPAPFEQQTPAEASQESAFSDPFAAFAGPPADATPSDIEAKSPVAESPAFQGPDFSGLNFPAENPTTQDASPQPAPEVPSGGFAGPSFEGPPPASDNKIETFAEKLQDAGKITPVIDFSTKMSSESTGEAAVNAGFVTPTLAEIYAKQGWYDDAINAYKTLARTRPADKEKFDQRVAELEEEKKKAG